MNKPTECKHEKHWYGPPMSWAMEKVWGEEAWYALKENGDFSHWEKWYLKTLEKARELVEENDKSTVDLGIIKVKESKCFCDLHQAFGGVFLQLFFKKF